MSEITLERLLGHAKIMGDYELKTDFRDCLLPLAPSQRAREVLEMYYVTRVKHSSFAPYLTKRVYELDRAFDRHHHNNHDLSGWAEREPGLLGRADGRACLGCGTPLDPMARPDAQTCSPRCKKRVQRRRSEAA